MIINPNHCNFLYICSDMLTRLLNILAFVAYINLLFHQDGHRHGNTNDYVVDGTPLIEVILEDVLNVPSKGEEEEADIQFEDYRPTSLKWVFSPLPPKSFSVSFPPLPNLLDSSGISVFGTKISCLPGYYAYLFRLNPF